MRRVVQNAPGRSVIGRPGAFLLMAALFAGCDKVPGVEKAPTLELAEDTIQLARGTKVADFRLHAVGDSTGIRPAAAQISPGDVVRFTAADDLTHAVAFDEAALTPKVRAFLEESGQLRGPPLVDKGTSWIVSLKDAPPGEYPFVCLSHDHRGRLVVKLSTK